MKAFSYKSYQEDPHVHVMFERALPEPAHTHDFIEIVYVNSGKMTHSINGQKFEASKGDLLFINYNSIHSFNPEGSATYYNICFYPETMESIISEENAFSLLALSAFNEISKNAQEGGLVSFNAKEQEKVQYLLETMIREQAERNPRYEEVNQSFLNILINWILRKTEIPGELSIDLKSEIAEYIDKNLDGDLSLQSLAKKCFYNPSYFSRLFRSKFKIPLVEYVANKRIEKAIQLLTDTELSISAIASACGFANKTAFYRAFSKITGKSPTDYRNKKNI